MIGNRFNLADATANQAVPQAAPPNIEPVPPQERFTSTDAYGRTARMISQMGDRINAMRKPDAIQKRKLDTAPGLSTEMIPENKRRRIKAGLVHQAVRRELPLAVAVGAGWAFRSHITNSGVVAKAQALVETIPPAVQLGLSGQLVGLANSVKKMVVTQAQLFRQNVNFLMNQSDNVPKHLKTIVDFHALKTLYAEHGSKMPMEVKARVLGVLNEVETQVNKHGGVYVYEAFNKTEPFLASGSRFDSVSSALSSIESLVLDASQKQRVSGAIDPAVSNSMLFEFPPQQADVLQEIFDNLLVPTTSAPNETQIREVQQTSIHTSDDLVKSLASLLSLNIEQTVALERMIDFHLAKAEVVQLKSTIETREAKSEKILKALQQLNADHAVHPTNSEHSLWLEAQIEEQYDQLDAAWPTFSKAHLKSLDKLTKLAEKSLLAHNSDAFDLNSFLVSGKKDDYLTIDKLKTSSLTPSVTRSIAGKVHVLDVTKAMQQILAFGGKPIKPFTVEGQKAKIERAIGVLDKQDIPLFTAKLKSVETLSSPYIPKARLEFDVKPSLYLEGPPGIGKTTLLRELAAATGLDVIEIKANVTIAELTQKLVECPSKNPMIIIDEAGEALSQDDFLGSVCRWMIDRDSLDREGAFEEHIPISLGEALSRCSFWMTGNEPIKSEKIISRTTTCKMPHSSETVRKERAIAAYLNDLKPTGRRPIANDRKATMRSLFEKDLSAVIAKTPDLRAITSLAGCYAVQQMDYFEQDNGMTLEEMVEAWPRHAKDTVLPNLDHFAANNAIKSEPAELSASDKLEKLLQRQSSVSPARSPRQYPNTSGNLGRLTTQDSVSFDPSIFQTRDSAFDEDNDMYFGRSSNYSVPSMSSLLSSRTPQRLTSTSEMPPPPLRGLRAQRETTLDHVPMGPPLHRS